MVIWQKEKGGVLDMKKGLILGLVLGLVMVSTAIAAPAAQVSVTVTITQNVSVTVTPGSYAFGSTDAGTTLITAVDAFTATNDGNGAENLTITVSDSADWTASTTAGTDAFVMNYYNGSSWSLIDPVSGASLASGLAPSDVQLFGVQLLVPTDTNSGGVEQLINVTVTAAAL